MISRKEQEELYKEISKYNYEYKRAIKELMRMNDINVVLSPLTALIMQYIENNLKAIIQDCFEIIKTANELQIGSHSCKGLLNIVNKKYERYLSLDFVNNQFIRIEECIDYLEAIYGENTLVNARYPVDKRVLKVNRKEHKVISDEYKIMFLVLRMAIENLIEFYGLERIYQKIMKTDNPREQLERFIDFCNKEYKKPKRDIKIWLVEQIDEHNANVLKQQLSKRS